MRRRSSSDSAAATGDAVLQDIADFHNGTPYTQTWQVQSVYTYKVQIEFFSQARSYAWPGANQAYPLDDSQTRLAYYHSVIDRAVQACAADSTFAAPANNCCPFSEMFEGCL